MIDITQRTPTAVLPFPLRPVILAVAALLSVLTVNDRAGAQFYRGYRGFRGPVIVAPPLAGPYYRGAWSTAPVLVGPPSSVRVQTPFFSLNLGTGPVVASPYLDYHYRYEAYRPRYGSSYEFGYSAPLSTVPPYRGMTPADDTMGRYESYRSEGLYRSGSGGGIPDLTPPVDFSLPALRDAAKRLYQALARRPDDGDVWLEYLQPDRIVAAADSGQLSPSIQELYTRFQGVTMNPDLVVMTRIDGFRQTFQLLGAWIEDANDSPQAAQDPPAGSSPEKPAAAAEADPKLPIPPPIQQEILPAPSGEVEDL
ncbi:hypothetical protein Mal15_31030 [Stieleria maiorica]|uniref:Uncharacterized protein n=1 Tax=Stieleria maiorica TaxID=2795974 RepID=A0A5B9MHD8_9BACT|nr:hypothetical protein [Stieleria maiorica]QEF99044.1 hypothetical protein Mal15_31030 [Stieleria maiorica]